MTIQVELYQILIFIGSLIGFGLRFYVDVKKGMAVQNVKNDNITADILELKTLLKEHIKNTDDKLEKRLKDSIDQFKNQTRQRA